MLGQKTPDFSDDVRVLEKAWLVEFNESMIDSDDDLYFITWSPSADQMPDSDFNYQHKYNVNLLASYLLYCECGLFCVESTQLGNPHYHGWYQTSHDTVKEMARICVVKVLQFFGNLKITKCFGHYRINSYTKGGNGLYYYKADLFGQMLSIDINPITSISHDTTDWHLNQFFFIKRGGRESLADIEAKITQREFYLQFYSKSDF